MRDYYYRERIILYGIDKFVQRSYHWLVQTVLTSSAVMISLLKINLVIPVALEILNNNHIQNSTKS